MATISVMQNGKGSKSNTFTEVYFAGKRLSFKCQLQHVVKYKKNTNLNIKNCAKEFVCAVYLETFTYYV